MKPGLHRQRSPFCGKNTQITQQLQTSRSKSNVKENKQLSLNPHLVTLAVGRASLRAEWCCTGCSSPALVALALQRRGIAAAVTTAGSRTQWESVGGVEAQEVVVGIAEEVKQHLRGRRRQWCNSLPCLCVVFNMTTLPTLPDLASIGWGRVLPLRLARSGLW